MTSYDRYDLPLIVVLTCILATAFLMGIQRAERYRPAEVVNEPRHGKHWRGVS